MSTQPEWRLRDATEADRELLYELHRAAFLHLVTEVWGWDEDRQRELFAERLGREQMDIVLVDEAAVGSITLWKRSDDLHLANLAIIPEWQGRGLGASILQDLRRQAQEREVPLTLQVLHQNPRARAFYEREGLRVTGETETHVLFST